MGKAGRREAATAAALERLYARLPTVACQGKCGVSCGPVPLTTGEARRLQMATHVKPRTVGDEGKRCVYLTPGNRCQAYAVRPLICRVFGIVKMLSCPHGCLPDRWLEDREFLAIAQAVERVGGPLVLTTLVGLEPYDGSYLSIPTGARSEARIAADAERTRSLRALHGGRILAAIREDE